jgi:glutathione S-transferase
MPSLALSADNKNDASWPLRPWLMLRHAGIAFEEVRIALYWPDASAQLVAWLPADLVPALHDSDIKVWDSLASCEYLNERFPDKQLWPADAVARAGTARAYAETMLALPAMQAWVADALAEPERIEMFERG